MTSFKSEIAMPPQVLPMALAALGSVCLVSPDCAEAQTGTVAIRNVTVVDVSDGSLHPERTVLVEGNRIAVVGAIAELRVPADADVLDATGAYLIPGLWDMHVHAVTEDRIEAFFPLFLANGITGIRDMGSSLDVADRVRRAVAAGDLLGPPRLIVAGNLVDGPNGPWPTSQIARTPEDGRRIVDSLYAAGAPFVKVYSMLSPEVYLAVAERARELGIPFVGHVPNWTRAADASDAGQRSMEHLYGVLYGCSSKEATLHARDNNALPWEERMEMVLATQDEDRCQHLVERFVENETWQVPTLIALRGYDYIRELATASDPRVRYLSPLDFWFPRSSQDSAGWNSWKIMRPAWERAQTKIVRMMAASGVLFLAGSDTPNPWVFPGFGLHDELALLVETGLTPLQALQAATLNPARFFYRTDELGTVAEGKLADLLVLDANPLADITNARRIRAVVADGRLYRRADLERLLAEVEASVQRGEKQK